MDRISVRAIIEYQGKYLLVRNAVSDTFWCLPGGGVEVGEDILSALERELIEELGVEPEIGNLLYVHSLKGPDGYGVPSFFFHIKNGSDYLNIDITSTSHGVKELAEFSFKDVSDCILLPSFLKTELKELKQADFNCPTKIRLTELEEPN